MSYGIKGGILYQILQAEFDIFVQILNLRRKCILYNIDKIDIKRQNNVIGFVTFDKKAF